MKRICYVLLACLPLFAGAQEKAATDTLKYPQHYFRNPLDIPIFLAGNFGECRPGHFHSGMDIKTLGKENQPVHAAADGYISRIKMEKGGFGHGLYITHPNGYTTLYAHLNDFVPALQQYLKKEQYAKKHWDVDIQLIPDQFPVKKGDQIAWSGNTGASTAPHLHFEIRDTKTEHPLNGELFGLPLIDNIAPLPAEVVIYGADKYNSGFYGLSRGIFSVKKEEGNYMIDKGEENQDNQYSVNKDTVILSAWGETGIGINIDDHMDGSDNTIAFYTAKLYMDDSLQVQVTLDNVGYEETRYINAYADYKIKEMDHKWVQCLFKLPGNHLDSIFSYLNNKNGYLLLENGSTHKIDIVITDDKGNVSRVSFFVRANQALPWAKGGIKRAWEQFYVNQPNAYADANISYALDSKALYDNIFFDATKHLPFREGYSDKYDLVYPYVPVHNYFELKIRPQKSIPHAITNKIVMMYSDGKDSDGRAATITDNGWYKARVRNFGTYWLDADDTPPVIKSEQKNNSNLRNAKQITFEVTDNKTSVKSFSGYLDGKWICFEQHNNLFFYKFDEHCPKGKHKLVFKAEDENNNERTIQLNFTR